MISLSDTGLAHLLIAAGQVPPARRARWLADLAARLERTFHRWDVSPSPAAARQRLRRARQRSGLAVLRIEADEAALVAALVDAKLLDLARADDKQAIQAALERLVALACHA